MKTSTKIGIGALVLLLWAKRGAANGAGGGSRAGAGSKARRLASGVLRNARAPIVTTRPATSPIVRPGANVVVIGPAGGGGGGTPSSRLPASWGEPIPHISFDELILKLVSDPMPPKPADDPGAALEAAVQAAGSPAPVVTTAAAPVSLLPSLPFVSAPAPVVGSVAATVYGADVAANVQVSSALSPIDAWYALPFDVRNGITLDQWLGKTQPVGLIDQPAPAPIELPPNDWPVPGGVVLVPAGSDGGGGGGDTTGGGDAGVPSSPIFDPWANYTPPAPELFPNVTTDTVFSIDPIWGTGDTGDGWGGYSESDYVNMIAYGYNPYNL